MRDVSAARSKRILIVDDDEGIRYMLKLALDLDGYDVYTAENGRQALEILSADSAFCLVLLDLMMPVMNGWEFIEELRAKGVSRSIPVVIITAYPNQGKLALAQGILSKPIQLEDLSSCVAQNCGKG